MSNFRRFKEYLDHKGKVQEKPIQSDDFDTGPKPEKYPQQGATSGKNWKTTTPQDKPKPYMGVGTDPGLPKFEKGFASDGDKKLIYEPKNGKPEKEGGTKLDSWPKGKTEAFLDDTKELTLSEFASYVSEQSKTGLHELPTIHAHKTGPFCPDPVQAMRYVVTLATANNRLMESLVVMLKTKGGLDSFLREAANHSDTYNELAFMLADPASGGTVARRLVKALSEVTVKEITDAPYGQAEGDEKPAPKKKKLAPDPKGPPAAQQPEDQGQNAKTPAMNVGGQPMAGGAQDMAGVQITQGGQPAEHHLVAALMAKKMI